MNPSNSIDELILEYATERGFRRETLERWLKLADGDRQAFLNLAQELKLGQNQLRDLLDWLDEIQLRDGVSCAEILNHEELSRIMSDPRLGRNDKLKRVKEALRRLRFPRLAGIEGKIQKKIGELKLNSQVVISVPPGLEGGTLSIQLTATRQEELKRLVEQMGEVVARDEMK